MKKLVKNNVYWVGKTDWELKNFPGREYSTYRGSSYNSYLVQEEKVALIGSVWESLCQRILYATWLKRLT